MSSVKKLTTRSVSPAEMMRNVARFSQLRPQSDYYSKDQGIPDDVYEAVTAKSLFTMMAPSEKSGPMSAKPAIVTKDKLSIIVAECPPGDKPMLHAHFFTTEHFFCLSGRFKIRWGDDGENELTLEPFDLIAVPPGVCRDFTNVSDQTAHLLVLITGESDEAYNDIAFSPSESLAFKGKFGAAVADKLETIGFSFLA